MNSCKPIFAILAVSMLAALVACGGGSHNNNNNNPISVSLGTPPASVAEKATASFTATVTNDSANAGVTWSATCGSSDCGSFTNNQSASGTANTYTAPAIIPSGGVTITATSVTDTSKNAAASVTITVASTLADGSYVYSLAGQDANTGNLYYAAGAFTVASGAVTTGEQDFADYVTPIITDAITGGSVSTTADGNVQIVLNTADTGIGVSGVETLSGTMVSGNRALINEFDASATSSGELDLQTTTSAGQGAYTFFVSGGDSGQCPATIGGIVNVDGPGTISGAGSVFDLGDCGAVLTAGTVDSDSTVSTPDSFGRIQVTLDLTTAGVGVVDLAGYIVDGNRIRLVEYNNDDFGGVTGGTAFAQGANVGTFSAASVQGSSYVFGSNGGDPNGFLQMAGALTFGANGAVIGTMDANDLSCLCTGTPANVQGSYTVDATGRVSITNLTDATGTFGPFNFEFYLDGNGNGSMGTQDGNDVVAGLIHKQTGAGSFSAGSFAGTYAFDTTGIGLALYKEFDTVGPANSDGVSSLTGIFDQNILGVAQNAGVTLTDGFTADPSGVFNGTMTGLDSATPTNQDSFNYYVIDTTKVVAIENDTNQLTLGYFELQQ